MCSQLGVLSLGLVDVLSEWPCRVGVYVHVLIIAPTSPYGPGEPGNMAKEKTSLRHRGILAMTYSL